jgi:hypothetical protein
MRPISGWFTSLLFAALLISTIMTGGCAAQGGYRVYDPYHNDYHRWDGQETGFYVQWEGETRRDHRDFDKRDKDEQKEYWDWRHKH